MIPHYAPLLSDEIRALPYIEAFAGGAAMFQHLSGGAPLVATVSDINRELIDLYRMVKSDADQLISKMCALEAEWMPLERDARKALYYDLRERYWQVPEGPEATALLYFLMRTGFNGIWQTCKASKGRYGTPVGLANQKVSVFDPGTVKRWQAMLSDTRLLCTGYAGLQIDQPSFIYCDPPYRDSFTSYGADFGDDAQLALIDWCRSQHHRTGSTVWLCNRDAGDGFFEDHAPDARLHRFPITYTAGRRRRTESGFSAKPATELLLTWGPEC